MDNKRTALDVGRDHNYKNGEKNRCIDEDNIGTDDESLRQQKRMESCSGIIDVDSIFIKLGKGKYEKSINVLAEVANLRYSTSALRPKMKIQEYKQTELRVAKILQESKKFWQNNVDDVRRCIEDLVDLWYVTTHTNTCTCTCVCVKRSVTCQLQSSITILI